MKRFGFILLATSSLLVTAGCGGGSSTPSAQEIADKICAGKINQPGPYYTPEPGKQQFICAESEYVYVLDSDGMARAAAEAERCVPSGMTEKVLLGSNWYARVWTTTGQGAAYDLGAEDVTKPC